MAMIPRPVGRLDWSICTPAIMIVVAVLGVASDVIGVMGQPYGPLLLGMIGVTGIILLLGRAVIIVNNDIIKQRRRLQEIKRAVELFLREPRGFDVVSVRMLAFTMRCPNRSFRVIRLHRLPDRRLEITIEGSPKDGLLDGMWFKVFFRSNMNQIGKETQCMLAMDCATVYVDLDVECYTRCDEITLCDIEVRLVEPPEGSPLDRLLARVLALSA